MSSTTLVQVTTPVLDEMTTVTIEPGRGGAAALADLLAGRCPVCTTALAGDGLCQECGSDDKPVRYQAVEAPCGR